MGVAISREEGEWTDLFIDGRKIGSVQMGYRHGKRTKLYFDIPPEVQVRRRELVGRGNPAEESSAPAA